MASVTELPCDGEGICMVCKVKPALEETLNCKTCATPWHVACLTSRPDTMAEAVSWECPDCSSLQPAAGVDAAALSSAVSGGGSSDLVAAIKAIEADTSLTDRQKAKRRQELLSGGAKTSEGDEVNGKKDKSNDVMDILGGSLNCSFCMQLPERPVTTPCGHNFCLKCFQRWIGQGKRTCANCRNEIPAKMASNPRINSALVMAIRMAKMSKSNNQGLQPKVYHFYHNQDRPDKAFTTERAKRAGKANACSGKIFVTVPPDHFGPIPAENDPERGQGVLVGECWEDRMECRQWGVHLPHVAGIAGQSAVGAQSVCLSGGYEDDEDHGEWFLYTGSGGRDLGGNKRTNKVQSSSQEFEKLNEALRVSCKKGYPVRVVRSHKEKRSAYAPEGGVRYDGVYRIEKCWRKPGIQGFIVCRYLFVRCDNDPAPWTSDDFGDRPRPLPVIKELKKATDITERKGQPAWDYNEEKGSWMWISAPPPSKKRSACQNTGDGIVRRKKHSHVSLREKLLKEFSCQICWKVMTLPITTPCAHNFCKGCLEEAFSGQSYIRQRGEGRRSLRAQKNIMKCPACSIDIADFLQNPQVNRELMGVIESLQNKIAEEEEKSDEVADGMEEKEGEEGADAGNDAEDECSEESEGLEVNAVNTARKSDEKSDNLQSSKDQAKTEEGDEKKEGSGDEKPKRIHKRKQCSDMENPPVVDSEAAPGKKRVKVAAAI